MAKPIFRDDAAFKCLRMGQIDGYHRAIEGRQVVDFSESDLRAVDFRGADLGKLIIRNAYLREADLRGCDLRHLDLQGVSLYHAKISGTFFPENVAPEEIQLSVQHGTRLRCKA